MWNWFNCYLSGRHDYGMWCEPGAIFPRCVHCGRRSGGWSLDAMLGLKYPEGLAQAWGALMVAGVVLVLVIRALAAPKPSPTT